MAILALTAASVKATQPLNSIRSIAGATITAGQVVYKDSDGTIKLSDANGVAPANTVFGVALNGASSGQPVSVCTGDPTFLHGLAGVVSGDILLLAETPGGITKTVSDVATPATIIVIGVANSATEMNLNPTPGGAI